MGMCLGLCALSDESIRKVLADPPLIWKVVAPDDPEVYEAARQEKPQGFLARLFGGRTSPKFPELSDETAYSDLDKAWHGIHYMLTQTAWEGDEPLNFLVSGGCEVGDLDVGNGPARVFSSGQVRAVHAALAPLDEEFLQTRFNPVEMTRLEIYPSIWDREPDEDDAFGYCAEYFATLKAFVELAAERQLGLAVYIS